MVTTPKRFCSAPSCSEKVTTGFCSSHKQQQRKVQTRYQHGATAYGRPWRRIRDAWLAEHPLCVYCQAEGRVEVAREVDHIIPHKGDDILYRDRNNLQSLCTRHHS